MNHNNRLKLQKNYTLLFFMLTLFLSFVFFNIGNGILFGRWKADFTAGKQYSLSENSEQIVENIKTPLYIRVYLSSNLSRDYPMLSQYSQFVLRYLENYKNLSPELIQIELKNPEPYSKIETEAKQQGLESFLSPDGQNELFFGAVFSNDIGDSYTIPNFNPGRRSYLERDISRIIAKINTPKERKIGLVSNTLPILNKAYGEVDVPNWAFLEQLKNDYEITEVSAQTAQIPFDIEALIIINPHQLHPLFSYALDQYVLRGGKVLMLVDSFSEQEAEIYGTASAGSPDLNKLLNNWGINYLNNLVVGDNSLSEVIVSGSADNPRLRNYPLWMTLSKKQINQSIPLTKGLKRVHLKSPGAIDILAPQERSKIIPLLTTTSQGGSVDEQIARFDDKNTVIEQYSHDSKSYNLGVLIEGKFDSIYINNILSGTGFEKEMLPFLPLSIEDGKIVIIADSDLLSDDSWINTEVSVSDEPYNLIPYAENGDLILKAIDYLVDNTATIDIANKNTMEDQKTIAQKIYQKSFTPYANDYELYKRQLVQKEDFIKLWDEAVKNKSLNVTMSLIKELEQNRQDIKQLQDKLKYIDYEIRQSALEQTNRVIMFNLVFIPLALLTIIWLVNILWTARRRRKVKEIIDEYKIS